MTENKKDIKNTTSNKKGKDEEKDLNESSDSQNENNINNYYNNNAETISKILIEKIISLTVTKVHSKETFGRIGDHCFNYIKKSIEPILKAKFIPYEIRHNETEKIFFDVPKANLHNTWLELQEPKTPIYDRSSVDQIKYSEFTPIEFEVIKSSNLSNNDLIAVDKDSDEKKVSLFNQNNDNLNNKEKDEIQNKKISENKIISEEKKEENEKKNEKKNIEKPRNNKGEGPWIDLPSYDLPEELYFNEYIIKDNSPEINELRKEMEYENKKKEEQKRIEEEAKRRELNLLNQQNKKLKNFDSNKLTFDSNGNIIKLKPKNNIESNLGNEFYWSKPAMKDIRTFRHLITKAPRNSFSNMKNKKLVDFAEGIVNQINSSKKINSSFKLDNIDDDEEESNISSNKNENGRRGSSIVHKKTIKKMREETEIIRNPNMDIFKNKNKNNKKDDVMIIPAGQNFDKIIPEVGVTIITGDKKRRKEGGLNFSEKFKKPSMEEFSKLAFDTENLNSKRYFTGNFSTEKILSSDSNNQQINDSITNNKNNNYIGYSQQFNVDNPLIQKAYSLNKNANEQNSFLSNQTSFNKSQLINEIQLSKNIGNLPNLRSVFTENDEVNYMSFNERKKMKSLRPTGAYLYQRRIKSNIFNTLSQDYEITTEKGFDKFNTKILKNRNWGSNNDNFGTVNNEFIKPHKGNYIRELGYRIVNTKLPRDRKFVMTSQNLPSKKVVFAGLNDSVDKNKEKENELVK
jgi:hypothetical protein